MDKFEKGMAGKAEELKKKGEENMKPIFWINTDVGCIYKMEMVAATATPKVDSLVKDFVIPVIKRKDLTKLSLTALTDLYNDLLGKDGKKIKKFESKEKGADRVWPILVAKQGEIDTKKKKTHKPKTNCRDNWKLRRKNRRSCANSGKSFSMTWARKKKRKRKRNRKWDEKPFSRLRSHTMS